MAIITVGIHGNSDFRVISVTVGADYWGCKEVHHGKPNYMFTPSTRASIDAKHKPAPPAHTLQTPNKGCLRRCSLEQENKTYSRLKPGCRLYLIIFLIFLNFSDSFVPTVTARLKIQPPAGKHWWFIKARLLHLLHYDSHVGLATVFLLNQFNLARRRDKRWLQLSQESKWTDVFFLSMFAF